MRKYIGYTVLVVLCLFLASGCQKRSGIAAGGVSDLAAGDKARVSDSVQDLQIQESISLPIENLQSPASSVEIVANQMESVTETSPLKEMASFIHADGTNLESRISVPEGYERVMKEFGSFQGYLRRQPMKSDQSLVLLYDGREKGNQGDHVAVFSMPVFNSDLQQCADSVMRMYAEYFWEVKAYDQIAFHLTNGFLMDYPSWKSGKRLLVNGNETSWVKKAGVDDTYETFLQYLKMVMSYAGTLSLDQESTPITPDQILAGDMFIKGGSPGHCVMVVDVAEDEFGGKCFLLAQGYMPAQDFHILKNPLHENDPWYYESEVIYPFVTPEYTFPEGSLKRWYGFVY